MLKLRFPDKRPGLRKEGLKEQVFCLVRKKWVTLTPEEWVRQQLLIWLEHEMSVPLSLIAVEKQIAIGKLSKRFDIVVFDRAANPFMLIECKKMEAELDFEVLRQVLNYNLAIPSTFLAVTNGVYLSIFGKKGNSLVELEMVPKYPK